MVGRIELPEISTAFGGSGRTRTCILQNYGFNDRVEAGADTLPFVWRIGRDSNSKLKALEARVMPISPPRHINS